MQRSTIEVQLEEALQKERMLTVLSAILGALTTLIAMIDLYGLLAYPLLTKLEKLVFASH